MTIPVIAPAIPRPAGLSDLAGPAGSSPPGGVSFASILNSAVSEVERVRTVALQGTEDLLINGKGDIHEVALMSQRAELSMELFQQVRNKLVQTYQEVMRMPM